MLNNQKPESAIFIDSGYLAVNSIFYTIQGEGPFAGRPAIFIRLAGCNLQCPGCDTEYTKRELLKIEQIHQRVVQAIANQSIWHLPIIVITGGEPFRQPIAPLVSTLLNARFTVQIETNGTLYQQLDFGNKNLHVICSPKAGGVIKNLFPYIKAFKYVISHDDWDPKDGLPNHALGHPCKKLFRPPPLTTTPIYIQPADAQDEETNLKNLEAARESSLNFGYILCLQLHKYLGME